MSITPEEVAVTYRALLGRKPESDRAIEHALTAGSVETLRKWILASPEFAAKLQREAPASLRTAMIQIGEVPLHTPNAFGGKPRIVFLHLMKTAGTSMRERLEEIAGKEPVWRVDVEGRPSHAKPADLARYRVVMGHMTFTDTRQIPSPRRVFTVLREPRERVVSLFHFLHRHREEVAAKLPTRRAQIAREVTLEEFLAKRDPLLRDSVQNVMTRILAGDYQVAGPDSYRRAGDPTKKIISGPQLLTLALTNLFSMDYVAFTDRLEEDRPKLMAALEVPDLGPFPRSNTKDSVNDTVEPRPEPEITPVAERLLARLTDLDRLLYRIARMHYG